MKTTLHYKFDAFISYSHKDEIWVRNVLLSVLEKNGVKVIIDFRDFKPGAPSVTEMERAIIESWKTILVLSPNYINSSWSEYESIMIATLDPAGREKRIIPILLEECDIPLRINYLTFLDFTNRSAPKLQWDRLIEAFDKKNIDNTLIEKKPNPHNETQIMLKISKDIHKNLRKILIDADELSTQSRLRSVFIDSRLSSFKSGIPEASSVAERADLLIDFLISRRLSDGKSLVIEFLEVLKSKVDSNDLRLVLIDETLERMRELTGNITPADTFLDLNESLSLQENDLERYKSILKRYRQNLILIEEQMAAFIDPRNVSPDIKIARIEIINKIQEIEKHIFADKTILSTTKFENTIEGMSNEDLIKRLEQLENIINLQFDKLSNDLASLHLKIKPVDLELINKILEEVHLGRVEQGSLRSLVDATGRAMKQVINHGVKINDPEVTKYLVSTQQSINSGVSLEQQVELTLPLIPFLIEYKVNLGTDFDLKKIWEELINKIKKPNHNQ